MSSSEPWKRAQRQGIGMGSGIAEECVGSCGVGQKGGGGGVGAEKRNEYF